MPRNNPQIIADASNQAAARRAGWVVLVCALIAGGVAAGYVSAQGLTLSHYDARAHLVVARRVTDSLTPGWRQFGAVWLPLPHLVNALPAQWDWAYRTGAIAVTVSVVLMAAGLAAFARRLFERTGSIAVALAPAVFILANPNVLYLQSTPMTEPMLIGLALLSLAAIDAWVHAPDRSGRTRAAWLIAALVMTRYEGWLIAVGLLVAAAAATRHRGWREWSLLSLPALAAIVIFLLLGYATTGEWFLSESFFVPENPAFHQPLVALDQITQGLTTLASPLLIVAGAIGAGLSLWRARRSSASLLPLALLLAAALPFVAFYEGHPLRIRYMVPLVAACSVLAAVSLTALPRRFRVPVLVAMFIVVVWTRPPWDLSAPMVTEAQWETPFRLERERVTAALAVAHDRTPVLASMGSLAHYMHEASAAGFNLRDFLHEGNGDLWIEALRSPRRSVRWILIEERAEGGDALAVRARADPKFLAGFDPVANGGGLVLYRRR